MRVIKRDGREVEFDINRIINAITKANNEEEINKLSDIDITEIATNIYNKLSTLGYAPNVEYIQDLVEKGIMSKGAYDVAQKYIRNRYKRELARSNKDMYNNILSLVRNKNEEIKQENSNKNSVINSTQRDYIAGEVSKSISRDLLLPEDVLKAHDEGIIHFHDMDYFVQPMTNCTVFNLDDMLQNGTVISDTLIEKPKSFTTACTVTSQIVAQVASNQYGGQTWSLAHLAPFVDVSRKKIRAIKEKEFKAFGIEYTEKQLDSIVENELRTEIRNGIQTIQYQLLTLLTTNGQTPFVTIFMYINECPEGRLRDDLVILIEEMLNQRIKGVKNDKGVYITQSFPKLIYVLQENNISEDSEYWWLTELAAQCTAKRMVPDYISEKIMLEYKGDVYGCMGCRSFLTPDRFTDAGIGNIANAGNYIPGRHKYYGRFNMGVVTLNLPYIALLSNGDEERFWQILDDKCELCHKALNARYRSLLGTKSDVAPILWQYGAYARLNKGETIDKLLVNGYATISLGYAGIAETTQAMKHTSHSTPEGKEFALKVMQFINDKCAEWKKAENIDYSVYGTPLESTTYKFAKALQSKFGKIKDVSDHNYISNSYHIVVREEVDAFDKLSIESEFQKLSPGGAISYVETPNLNNNIEVVLEIMKHIYNHIMYAELNTKSDYCSKCGYDGEIITYKDEHGKLDWKCPKCGCTDHNFLHVARRTCGLTL